MNTEITFLNSILIHPRMFTPSGDLYEIVSFLYGCYSYSQMHNNTKKDDDFIDEIYEFVRFVRNETLNINNDFISILTFKDASVDTPDNSLLLSFYEKFKENKRVIS